MDLGATTAGAGGNRGSPGSPEGIAAAATGSVATGVEVFSQAVGATQDSSEKLS